jgi:polar amino acid transport system substrate-binding protein
MYSLISAGTEKSSVKTAQASIVGKAKSRPDLVKQVLDNVQREGLVQTYNKVKNRLDNFKELGYSSAGVVIESAVDEFKVGDRVSCAGVGYASHSEVVFVPKNLTCKIPENVAFKEAAFGTLGSIAMQGVRQANLRLGENVVIIGLGLLGQIAIQLCNSLGCNTIGIDISDSMIELAIKRGAVAGFKSIKNEVEEKIFNATKGLGADAVIITAGTLSNEPVEIAGEILRDRGRVIIVGAIKADIPRKPYYDKEIDIRFSRSYGPGRYDSYYEEKGIDYPIGYVRFTENRNLESFLNLLSRKLVSVDDLITHEIPVENGIHAYDILTGKVKEKFLGMLIKYSEDKGHIGHQHIYLNKNHKKSNNNTATKIGFIGAGNFAQSNLLPYIKEAELKSVCTTNPLNAKSVSQKFNFQSFTTNPGDILDSEEINTVFIATRHNSHAKYVIEALKKDKNIFVEKPLALNKDDLETITALYKEKEGNSKLTVGFNRRFSLPFKAIKEFFNANAEPYVINYRVNAGYFPPENWYQDIEQGYRIVSEGCHFIDVMQFITGAKPVKVFAQTINSSNKSIRNYDSICVTINFSDGSVGNLLYLANGSSKIPKEYCEVSSNGMTAVMDNFTKVKLFDSKKKELSFNGKKGHEEEVLAFLDSLKDANNNSIDFDSLYYTTLTTLRILDSVEKGTAVNI